MYIKLLSQTIGASVMVAVLGLVSLAPAASASALDTTSSSKQIIETAKAIAGDLVAEPSESTTNTAVGTNTVAGTTEVVVGTNPSTPVEITDEAGNLLLLAAPDNLNLGTGAVADGATVYQGESIDLTVIPAEQGGIQALVSINSPSAPSAYTFDLDLPNDTTPVKQPDGSIMVTTQEGEILGGFEAPWAIDANGAAVPTEYSIDNGQLTQIVRHADGDYAYPVIADPWWNPFSWDWKKISKKCVKGAVVGVVGGGTAKLVTNAALQSTGKALVQMSGGVWGYAGLAAGGCVVSLIK